MREKGLAPIVVVLIVAGLFGAFYLGKTYGKPAVEQTPPTSSPTLSTTEDETANWKTYENTKYKYSFQYPAELKVDLGVSGAPADDSKLETIYQIKLHDAKQTNIWVSVLETNYKSISEFSDSLETSRANSGKISVLSKETTILDRVQAIRYVIPQPEAGNTLRVSAILNGYVYTLTLDSPDSDKTTIFDQILSTFRFTQ